MPWTGNNTWTCNQCKYTVTAFGSVVSGGVSDSANQKTVRKLRIIIAHMEEHNRKKREMSKQDEQAGQALHRTDPWQYHALTDRIPDPQGCCYDGQDFTKEELSRCFDLVQNPDHWKGPIDAFVTELDLVGVKAAVAFFTATEVVAVWNQQDSWYHVTSVGYWEGPAGP